MRESHIFDNRDPARFNKSNKLFLEEKNKALIVYWANAK